jgi:hypothetical protein
VITAKIATTTITITYAGIEANNPGLCVGVGDPLEERVGCVVGEVVNPGVVRGVTGIDCTSMV